MLLSRIKICDRISKRKIRIGLLPTMPVAPSTLSFRRSRSLADSRRSKRVLNLTRRNSRRVLVPRPGIQIHLTKAESATQAQAAVGVLRKATKQFEKTNKRLISRGEKVCQVKQLFLRQGKSWSRTTRLSFKQAR